MDKNNSFVVVSCCIPGHGDFEELKASLRKFGIQYDLRILDKKEGRLYGYSQAIFLKKMLYHYRPHPVVWMDPGTCIRRYPAQFDVQSTEVAVYVDDKNATMSPVIIYLANNKKTQLMLDTWIERNEFQVENSERLNLRLSLLDWQAQHKGKIGMLPVTYVDGTVCGGSVGVTTDAAKIK